MDRPETATYGYVYVGMRADFLVKIGCTLDPVLRRRQIELASGVCFERFDSWHVYAPGACERWLHEWYQTNRIHGEWFQLNEETVIGIVAYMQKTVSRPV